MLTINLADVDKLYDILLDLEILTYLRFLVENEEKDDLIDTTLLTAYRCAPAFLWSKQLEAVKAFRELLTREDFVFNFPS